MNINVKFLALPALIVCCLFPSCSKTESYSDLLKKEQKVTNWYLAQHKVCNEIPSDSVFEMGPDAPYYRMDPDGYIYMQVLSAPAPEDRIIPATGEQVYFTFTRYNIETMYSENTFDVPSAGNQDNFLTSVGNTYFIYNNYSVSSSKQFGSGIQTPLSYLGFNSEVNIVLKSYYGFSDESATCVPFLVNTRYFKAEY